MRPLLDGIVGDDGDACDVASLGEVEAAGKNIQQANSSTQQQQQHPGGPTPGTSAEAGNTEVIGNTRNNNKKNKKVELTSLGGRINATHRKISKTAGTPPRMISDAVRDDLLDAIDQFVSKVCTAVCRLQQPSEFNGEKGSDF